MKIKLENLHKNIAKEIKYKGTSFPKKHGEYIKYKINDYLFELDTWSNSIDVIIERGSFTKKVWLGSCWGGYKKNVSELMLMYYYLIITEQGIPYMFFDKEDI